MANAAVYGMHHLKDVFNQRVTEVGVDVVNNAVTQWLAEHNRQLNAMRALFVRETTQFKTTYLGVNQVRNQPLDTQGRALPVKPGGKYEVAFPIQMSGSAIGWDWVTFQKTRVEEVNRALTVVEGGDIAWMWDHILAALLTNVTWPYTDEEHGALTIAGLANGDTTTYQVFAGAGAAATDDHYLGQAAAIADATNPYPTIFTELNEHPENAGGRVIALIPTGLKATTQALATFNPIADPNVQRGSASDVLVGSLGIETPGTVIGYEDSGVWIVEYPRLPAGYIIAVADGGEPPLAMRQDEEASLQGFVETPAPDGNDYPYLSRHWIRRCGFGPWNRVAALAMEIGDASYDIPTGFTSPMP